MMSQLLSDRLLQLADAAFPSGVSPNRRPSGPFSHPTTSVVQSPPSVPAIPSCFFASRVDPMISSPNKSPAGASDPSAAIPAAFSSLRRKCYHQTAQQQPPHDFVSVISAVLNHFGFDVTPSHQQSPPTSPVPSLTPSEWQPRRQPSPLRQHLPDSSSIGVRFAIPAPLSAPERIRPRRRSLPLQLLRRLHSFHERRLGTRRIATFSSSRRTALASSNLPVSVFGRSLRAPKIFLKCVVVPVIVGPVLSSHGSVTMRQTKFVVLTWSAITSTTVNLRRDSFFCSVAWISRTPTANGCASSPSPAPNPSPRYASRTTDLSSRAYPNFSTENQLDLAVEHFISGLRDASTRDYLRRERARRRITWQEAVQMAQACEVPRVAEYPTPTAAIGHDATPCAKSANFANMSASCNDCAMAAQPAGNTGNTRGVENTTNHVRPARTGALHHQQARPVSLRQIRPEFVGPLTPEMAPHSAHPSNSSSRNHSGISTRIQDSCGCRRHTKTRRVHINTRRYNN